MDDEVVRRRSLDFYMGIAFAAIGVVLIVNGIVAYSDPFLASVPVASNPGGTTIVIGGVLALLGAVIAIMGFAGSNKKPFSVAAAATRDALHSRSFWKGALALGLIAIYFFVLWRIMPFWLSTPIYLLANMFIFKGGKWWKLLIITAVTTGLVYFIFARLAYVPLP